MTTMQSGQIRLGMEGERIKIAVATNQSLVLTKSQAPKGNASTSGQKMKP